MVAAQPTYPFSQSNEYSAHGESAQQGKEEVAAAVAPRAPLGVEARLGAQGGGGQERGEFGHGLLADEDGTSCAPQVRSAGGCGTLGRGGRMSGARRFAACDRDQRRRHDPLPSDCGRNRGGHRHAGVERANARKIQGICRTGHCRAVRSTETSVLEVVRRPRFTG